MTKGWTVAVRRRPRPRSAEPEMWDCAIPIAWDAERAVRQAWGLEGVSLITARQQLTVEEVAALGLQDGQIRKRPTVQPTA